MSRATRLVLAFSVLLVSWSPLVGQDRFFDSNGATIHYVEEGTGDPVVLVHGITASINTWVSSGLISNLSKTHRVVALDLRGHGKSDKPTDPRAYGREMGLDIIRLLDHLGIDQAHILGYSLGGIIVSQLLTTHPHRFKTAILLAGVTWLERTPDLERTFQLEADETERDCVSRSLLVLLLPPGPALTDAEFKTRSDRCMADPNQNRLAIAAILRSRTDLVISAEAAAMIPVPILAVVGDQDPFFLGMLGQLKRARPSTQLLVVPGATHSGAAAGVERTPEFRTALRGMLVPGGS